MSISCSLPQNNKIKTRNSSCLCNVSSVGIIIVNKVQIYIAGSYRYRLHGTLSLPILKSYLFGSSSMKLCCIEWNFFEWKFPNCGLTAINLHKLKKLLYYLINSYNNLSRVLRIIFSSSLAVYFKFQIMCVTFLLIKFTQIFN